jgi:hypothetical protein
MSDPLRQTVGRCREQTSQLLRDAAGALPPACAIHGANCPILGILAFYSDYRRLGPDAVAPLAYSSLPAVLAVFLAAALKRCPSLPRAALLAVTAPGSAVLFASAMALFFSLSFRESTVKR